MRARAGLRPCLADCLQCLRRRDILLLLGLLPWGLGITCLHITQSYAVLSLRAKASSYLNQHDPFDLLWALPSPTALVCSPGVPPSTPPAGSFYLKPRVSHPREYPPPPWLLILPPHLIHTSHPTSPYPHRQGQAHLCPVSRGNDGTYPPSPRFHHLLILPIRKRK